MVKINPSLILTNYKIENRDILNALFVGSEIEIKQGMLIEFYITFSYFRGKIIFS